MDEFDLQAQIGAMQQIIAVMLAQYALNFDEPSDAFQQVRGMLGAVSVAAAPPLDRTNYAKRLNTETERLLEAAAVLVSKGASQRD